MAYRIGIDAGSKTLKLVVLDEAGELVYSTYMRHRANIMRTLTEAIHGFNWRHGAVEASIAMTGSAAIEVASALGIPFVQEVVATTNAVRALVPDADVAIELGGEDAKIIYLTGGIEQRMNASCAGGTGGFIDTIAYMLDVKPGKMSRLAFGSTRSYPIASRCAVFAQSDVRPLLNAGVSKADIAASVFDAVVHQTLGGLACGRPIHGKVVFLGGPLEHMPYLVHSFRKALDLAPEDGVKPVDAHLFTVTGAALLSEDERRLGCAPAIVDTSELLERIEALGAIESDLERLEPLFPSEEERAAFVERHDRARFERRSVFDAEGPLYLGIDAGSTTLKVVALDREARIVFSFYEPIKGNLIETLRDALGRLYRQILPPAYLPHAAPKMWIARACATGYGEELLRAAFGVDEGIVETAAHLRSARELCPDLTFLLDIGGQDMKALWVRQGMVVDAALNEACSSGCGAFVEGTAAALKSTPHEFARMALEAEAPIDLGTKCTVFMNSRVKQAQKIGAPVDDIAAGIAYSVVKNALHRIIGDDRKPGPGDKVVVQGGTFKSDAVLRAFELLSGLEVIRPAETQVMGSIGCALYARDASLGDPEARSALIGYDELEALKPRRRKLACTGCANGCQLTVVTFDDEGTRHFITDNQCERGLYELARRAEREGGEAASAGTRTTRGAQGVRGKQEAREAPNVVALEQRLLGEYGALAQGGARGGIRIGMIDSMALYAYRPFWRTLFARLGSSVALPEPGCETDQLSEAWETIPSESVCYPAKVAHLRYFNLCAQGCDAVFMPLFERELHCPVQTRYAEALAGNVTSARRTQGLAPIVAPELANYKPARFLQDPTSLRHLLNALDDVIGDRAPAIALDELRAALVEALRAQDAVTARLEQATDEAFAWLAEDPARHGIVLAGRPYHMDDALLHGIDRELERLGFAVLSASGLGEAMAAQRGKRMGGAHPWFPAKRLVRLAHVIAENPQLDAVFLQSFGCGYEPLSLAEAADVLEAAGKPCTVLMLDDISDLAHIRIRLRTLEAAIRLRGDGGGAHRLGQALAPDSTVSSEMRVRHEGDEEHVLSCDRTRNPSTARPAGASLGMTKGEPARDLSEMRVRHEGDEEHVLSCDLTRGPSTARPAGASLGMMKGEPARDPSEMRVRHEGDEGHVLSCDLTRGPSTARPAGASLGMTEGEPARDLSEMRVRHEGDEGQGARCRVASFFDSIEEEALNAADLECARKRGVKDICFTANALAARVIRMLERDPSIAVVELPKVCETCVTQAVPRIVERATGLAPEYVWIPWPHVDPKAHDAWGDDAPRSPERSDETEESVDRAHAHSDELRDRADSSDKPRVGIVGNPEKHEDIPAELSDKPRVGIVGNPLLVLEPFMNDSVVEMLEELGCEAILPDPALVSGEDVRYFEQLEAFERAGIRDVIYLLSFGCLKGHVQGRGALRELRRRFPDMNITIIDYDPETSALNRENRIRLAVEAARDGTVGQ